MTVKLIRISDGTELFDLRRPLGAGLLADKLRPAPARLTIAGVEREGKGCPCVVIQMRRAGTGRGLCAFSACFDPRV